MMQRRDLLKYGGIAAASLGWGCSSMLAKNLVVNEALVDTKPLRISKVEPLVIRYPKDNAREDELVGMSPIGTTTSGKGLWKRLDHDYPAYPTGHMQATLVKITTDQGVIGWGQCHAPLAPKVHERIIKDLFTPILMGQDARNIEVLWERMYSTQRMRGFGTGFFIQSIAGIDLALWDIFGKYLGLPVYQLLGGKYRGKISTYIWIRGDSPSTYRESALHAVEQGYTAMKMGIRDFEQLDRVAAVSEAIKGKGQVFVVATGLKLYEAVRIGRELDKMGNIGWLQEPLLPEDSTGYQKLTEEIDTAVCYGAFLGNRFLVRDVLVTRAVDIINPDICYCGGITESHRMTILADAYGVLWSPHVSMASPSSMAASMHLAAATPNFVIMESADQAFGPFGNKLLKEPLDYHAGFATVPERPGLGVEYDEQELAKVTIN